jgi:hypothetical protein
MKLAPLLLLSLVSAYAQAAEVVQVKWRVSYTDANGQRVSLSEPDAVYKQALRKCGLTKNGKVLELVPAGKLRCPGLLDFASSNSLRARVVATIKTALASSHQEKNRDYAQLLSRLQNIDFGLSPYGVFRSSRDGYGDPRRMGLNIRSQNLVVLNQKFWELVNQADNADAFLLHEALGAAAYEDTDYQVSLDLNEIAQGRNVALPKLTAQKGRPELVARGGDDGGITITGHGGDSDEQIIKLSLLRAIEDANITIKDLDAKYWPSKEELRALVSATPVTIVNYFTLKPGPGLCRSYDGKTSARGLCGGFALKGATGTPFLLVAREFAAAKKNIQQLMLEKIYLQMVTQLAEEKAAHQ